MNPPDLVAFHVIHRGMRSDSARLARAVAEIDEAERYTRAHTLRRWFDGFVGELNAHHTVEDELFFPALAQRVSVFEREVGRIEAEHAHLDAALDRARRAIERLGDPETPWGEASRRAITHCEDLHELLDRHLAFEDEFVLPLFVRHFSADDYQALDALAARYVSITQLPFTIAWAMDNAEPEEQRSLLDGAPLVFKVLWWATRGQYRRLVDDALGRQPPAAAPAVICPTVAAASGTVPAGY